MKLKSLHREIQAQWPGTELLVKKGHKWGGCGLEIELDDGQRKPIFTGSIAFKDHKKLLFDPLALFLSKEYGY